MIAISMSSDGNFMIAKSTEGFYIRKVGTNEIYSEAWDLRSKPCRYEETDQYIVSIIDNEDDDDIII